jgi:hypothetical protein
VIASGRLDVGAAVVLAGETFAPFVGEPHRYAHLPSGLVVPPRVDDPGLPDIAMELVRSRDAGRPPEPHGLLDLRLQVRPPAAEALELLAAADPRASVTPTPLVSGFLRIELLAAATTDPAVVAAVAEPAVLASNGLDAARVVRYLPSDAAVFLSDALSDGAAALAAQAELVVAAVAARRPITVTFAAADLNAALADIANPSGLLGRADVVEMWTSGRVATPGVAPAEVVAAAEVLADWTLALTAVPAPSPHPPVTATYHITSSGLSGDVKWNLGELRSISRVAVADLDLAEAVRRAVASDATSIFREEVEVDALETGMVEITVDDNLPAHLAGVAMVGVQLVAPAAPPWRVNRLSASCLLTGEPPKPVRWQLSPRETLGYDVTTFAIVSAPTPGRVDGPARHETGRRVLVGVQDLPMELATVAASQELLAEAVVHVTTGATAFDLTTASPQVAAPVVDGQTLSITATSVDGARTAAAQTRPAHSTLVTQADFPAYGTHQVQVSVEFDTSTTVVVVALQPENGGASTIVAFTPELTSRAWTYHNSSIFGGGYRYRASAGTPTDSEPFSAPQMSTALALQTSELADPPSAEKTFDAEGFSCVRSAEPDTWSVMPHSPGLGHAPSGHPLLSVIPTGDGAGLLQLEARLLADDDGFERLRHALATHLRVDPAVLRLQPAPSPSQVKQAELLVTTADGMASLATNPTSGLPPYTAIFSVALDAQTFPHAAAATAGQSGHLFVRYDVQADPAFASAFNPTFDVGSGAAGPSNEEQQP